jgi:hypothetical protein
MVKQDGEAVRLKDSYRDSEMGKKRVLSVGYYLAGGQAEYVDFLSDQSLLDAEIVLFEPDFGEVDYSERRYNGRRILTERFSAEVPRRLSHWNSELRAALAAGKLIVVFLTRPVEALHYTGKQEHSGTGRSGVTINIVDEITSYAAIPHLGGVTPKSGSEVSPNGKVDFFAPFWAEFRDYIEPYEVWIEGKFSDVLLQTRTGNKVVGAALRQAGGAMLFLPPFRYRRTIMVVATSSGGSWSSRASNRLEAGSSDHWRTDR